MLHIYGHYILVCDEDVVKQVNKSYFENERYVSITTTHVMFSQLLNNFHKENNNNTTQTLSQHTMANNHLWTESEKNATDQVLGSFGISD